MLPSVFRYLHFFSASPEVSEQRLAARSDVGRAPVVEMSLEWNNGRSRVAS